MPFTDDPVADYARWDAEQARAQARLPRCSYCEEPIQQNTAVCIGGDEWFCDGCLKNYLRKPVKDYFE